MVNLGTCTLIVAAFAALSCAWADAAGRGAQEFSFDAGAIPDGWRTTGDVAIDAARNHGEGAGGSLRIGPGARAVLPIAPADSVGRIDLWVFEDGTQPADPRAYRDGPVWGVISAAGDVQAVGPIYASYLSGADSYAFGMSPDGKGLYRDVFYLGVRRNTGWHKWSFVFDNDKGLKVLYDDRDVDAGSPRIIQDNLRARGFTSVLIAGDTGAGQPQTIWVDDVSVQVTGPLTSTGVPESKVTPSQPVPEGGLYAAWKNGPPKDPAWFPIAVWLQDPERAAEYRAIGVNLYIGLWRGPTEGQLSALKAAGMPVVCDQNQFALSRLNDPTIVAWMQQDEPDNAQGRRGGGYGPPVTPERVVELYNEMKAADPTRPVFLNLGQGVAWDHYIGRGTRTNKPEDYPEYVKGCDIASFDIYPAVHNNREIQGKLWKVPYGAERLIQWTAGRQIVWNCIECTRISNPNTKPTPAQVRTEVWMSLIHGSRGIVYFVHQFQTSAGPSIEAGLLADAEMAQAVGRLNRQIISLAPVLNTATIGDGASVTSSNKLVPVDVMVKRHGGATYLFAVAMRDGETTAAFTVPGVRSGTAEAIDEGRSIEVRDGAFSDSFKGYEVHLYRVTGASPLSATQDTEGRRG